MRIKLDENLGRRWADQLRHAGHEVHTVHDESLSGASDDDVLAAAVAEDRALITLDLDFANPIRFPPGDTAGIVVLRIRDRTGLDDLDRLVGELIDTLTRAEPRGRLWIVERDRVRQYEAPPDD